MFKIKYYTKRLLEYLDNEINRRNTDRFIWLGYNPAFPAVYDMLLEKGVKSIRILDNNKDKHGWEVTPVKKEFEGNKIVIESVTIRDEDKNALIVCSNAYYKEFVVQLEEYGIKEDQILDIYGTIREWTNEEEAPAIKNYRLIQGRELQLEELKILQFFRDFCSDHQLRWYIAGGTLLGAVRHKGFIPWDDDVDVYMPYEDYTKLVSLFGNNDTYTLLDWRTESKYPLQFIRLIRNNTYQLSPLSTFGYFTTGCCIDVFPIAGYPDDREAINEKFKRHVVLDREWRYCITMKDLYGDQFADFRQEIADEKYKLSFYESNLVGAMQKVYGSPWAAPRELFDKCVDLEFEGDKFPAPIGYDEYLKLRYGDYMTPPPKDQQRVHSYPTYFINQ